MGTHQETSPYSLLTKLNKSLRTSPKTNFQLIRLFAVLYFFVRSLRYSVTEKNVTEVDKLYDNWYTELMRIVDKHLPLKRVKARKIDVPYITGEWKEAIRKKRKYAKKFSQSKTKDNMELMKKWRNNATRLRRKAIKNYWNAICEDMNNNSRRFYNTFTPFLRTKPKKDKSLISFNIEGVTH